MNPAVAVQAHQGTMADVRADSVSRPRAGASLMPPGRGERVDASGPGAPGRGAAKSWTTPS
jgi:hypothetical protein